MREPIALPDMQFDYLNLLVFASVGFAFVFVNMILGSILRPKRKVDEGLETYECGEETIGDAWLQFDIRYYTVALVYVVFAVEIAFLFPWAIVVREALTNTGAALDSGVGAFAIVEGVLFILILFLGLAYVWAKGDLDWVLTYSAPAYDPPEHRRAPRQLPSVHELTAAAEPADENENKTEKEDEEAA